MSGRLVPGSKNVFGLFKNLGEEPHKLKGFAVPAAISQKLGALKNARAGPYDRHDG